MDQSTVRLGVDVGALFFKAVGLDENENVTFRYAERHQGNPWRAFMAMLATNGVLKSVRLAVSGALAETLIERLKLPMTQGSLALREAVVTRYPQVRNIVDIGGGSLSLISVGEDGSFRGYRTNSLCAAGTGSFLDEQSARLGVTAEELAKGSLVETPPTIAARCAVFAKSDLIHRQQEGFSKQECWSGLCQGLTHNVFSTLFKGRPVKGLCVLVGGVALNPEVVRFVREEAKDGLAVPDDPHLMQALGAALMAENEVNLEALRTEQEDLAVHDVKRPLRPVLQLNKSEYPSFDVPEQWIDENKTEVRLVDWPANQAMDVVIGLDIGSTSTKAILIDRDENVVADYYRKTAGDPIQATKYIFQAITDTASRKKGTVTVHGIGTTGSGRKLVGAVIGADRIVNEITAHVTGAIKTDPAIDTIFEIGGQDAKYIHTQNGQLRDSNMNYVCAAGTGSFIEEQVRKLGFDLFKVGEEVMGVTPPVTSDRCTVFMEQDAHALIRDGHTKAEVMAAVMYSVVQNYLAKVVGKRYYSKEKIFFQGATARNRGLVAAFENLLGVEVVVSPYCHVMGSFGVALITLREMREAEEQTRFVGLDFVKREVTLTSEHCQLCSNHCKITYAQVEGRSDRPSWGYLCGRDAEEETVRVNREYRYFQKREAAWRRHGVVKLPKDAPVIGIPRALVQHTYLPMWRRFFGELGYQIKLSPKTTRDIVNSSSALVGADYCFPVKLAHGHMHHLLTQEGVDYIFAPNMVSSEGNDKTTETHFCPYNIGIPSMLRSSLDLNDENPAHILSAVLNLRWTEKTTVKRLDQAFGKPLKVNKKQVHKAWLAAMQSQADYEADLKRIGEDALADLKESGKPGVVILGRPYNVYDEGSNLSLPRKIGEMGYTVLPLDILPLDDVDLGKEFKNMFWAYGRRILEGARFVADQPNLFAVYFSNFSCGPDSFLQTYVEAVMGEKPMLMLELDEHSADAGYVTRLEAFSDVLKNAERQLVQRFEFTRPPEDMQSLQGKTLWFPPMHPYCAQLMADASCGAGYNAKMLPVETADAFRQGREYTRGTECVPYPSTIGTFLNTIRKSRENPANHAFFMATACGPCRFGQYSTGHRMILDRIGWKDTPIVSWNSTDSYEGLPGKWRRVAFWAITLGDVVLKMITKTRPYELEPGAAQRAADISMKEIGQALREGRKPTKEVKRMAQRFEAIPVKRTKRPLVGIVGEIYVRCNPFCNQYLIERIERAGGEAWLAPVSEWILYTAYMEAWLKTDDQSLGDRLSALIKNRFMTKDEEELYKAAGPLLADRHEPDIGKTMQAGQEYIPVDFEGETILTIARAIMFIREGASMVVNAAPFGCMPGAMTTGILQQVEERMGVPVVPMFYDGETDLSGRIEVALANIVNATEQAGSTQGASAGRAGLLR